MKNLLIYTSTKKEFSEENKTLTKIQIDNSLDLGWSKEDLLLFTNFDYEYNGVKSMIVPDLYHADPTANKIPVIVYLMENGLLEEDEIYWYHDFDAYQNDIITEEELKLVTDFGLCTYGYKKEWNLGGFFFRLGAYPIFKKLNNALFQSKFSTRTDEKYFMSLVKHGMIDRDTFQELNITYNITMRYAHDNYARAVKPLRVLHFHPWYIDERLHDTTLNIFMYGKNKLKIPYMSERLIKVFNNHNIK